MACNRVVPKVKRSSVSDAAKVQAQNVGRDLVEEETWSKRKPTSVEVHYYEGVGIVL